MGELNGDFLSKGDTMDISFVTTDAAITCDMKVAWVNITLFGFDAMNDDGPEAIFNQCEMKFLNASLKMAKLLAVNMYLNGQTSTGRAKYLNGFSEWYDDDELPNCRWPDSLRHQRHSDGTVGRVQRLSGDPHHVHPSAFNMAYGNACWGSDHPDISRLLRRMGGT